MNTPCPNCNAGHVVWNGEPDSYYFTCSHCEWECGRGGAHPGAGLKGLVGIALHGGRVPKDKPRKKQPKQPETPEVKFIHDSADFKTRLHAEIESRMILLTTERAKFPPTNIMRKGKLVPNPKFTDEMRDHMHKFYVDHVEIREELLKS